MWDSNRTQNIYNVTRNEAFHINSGKVDSANGLTFTFHNEPQNAKWSPSVDTQIYGYNKNLRKDKPFCTHCNFSRHTINRCYKLHGYLPRHKPKSRAPNVPTANTSIN